MSDKLWKSVVLGVILLTVTVGPPLFVPQPLKSPEEVWKILYPQGIPEKVTEEDLPRWVHPAIWYEIQTFRGGKIHITERKKPNREGEISAFRCFLIKGAFSHSHHLFYWGGALPLADSVEVIQQAPYTLWKVKGVRTAPHPVEFDEKGAVTSPDAQVGDYFLKSRTDPYGIVEYMHGCVATSRRYGKSITGNFEFPIIEPEKQILLYDGNPPASWDDLLRDTYWDAILKQVQFAAFIYFYERDSLPRSREDLTSVVGEEIKEHWTPAVTTFVDYLLKRME